MKKLFSLAIIALGLLSGGCALSVPINPAMLMMLMKNDDPQAKPVMPDTAKPGAAPADTASAQAAHTA